MSEEFTVVFKRECVKEPEKIIKTSTIPRIGERVFLGFFPACIVKDVVYDYENKMIAIEVY